MRLQRENTVFFFLRDSANRPELARASTSKRVLMQNLSYVNELDLHEISTCRRNYYEWFRTKTRFDTEAKGISEIACYQG